MTYGRYSILKLKECVHLCEHCYKDILYYHAYNVRLNGIKSLIDLSFFMWGCLHVCLFRRDGNSIKILQFGVYNDWRLRNNVKH